MSQSVAREPPARIQVNKVNGKVYLQIDHIGDRTREPYLGSQEFFPFTEANRNLSLDQLKALYDKEKAAYEQQETSVRKRLELEQSLTGIIQGDPDERRREMAKTMYKQLTGKDFH